MSILRAALLLGFLSLAATTTRAQVFQGYVEGTVAHVSNAESGLTAYSGPYGISSASTNYSSFSTGGFILGATFNGWPDSVVSLGLDLRANVAPANPGYLFFLEGIKVSAKPRRLPFQPYFEVAVSGIPGHTRVPSTSSGATGGVFSENPYKTDYYVYQGYLGADRPIRNHLEWRVLEVGGGTSVGSGHHGITLLTFSTGVVARF